MKTEIFCNGLWKWGHPQPCIYLVHLTLTNSSECDKKFISLGAVTWGFSIILRLMPRGIYKPKIEWGQPGYHEQGSIPVAAGIIIPTQ